MTAPAPPGRFRRALRRLTADDADQAAEHGHKVILVRNETSPEDVHGMMVSEGILTARGGLVSHAAVVARGMGRTCVCGAESLDVDTKAGRFTTQDGTVVAEGTPEDVADVDGSFTGEFLKDVLVN